MFENIINKRFNTEIKSIEFLNDWIICSVGVLIPPK